MQIGILQCDHVRSSLSPEFGEYPHMFEAALSAANPPENDPFIFSTFKVYEGMLPERADECDAYIITGSRFSVLDTEALWIHQLQNFIVRLYKAQIKTIGVCFGHQIMAVALGGKVERADCGWQIGAHQTRVVEIKPFMKPSTHAYNVAMFCEDQVVKIGDTATVLAVAEHCPYAMLQYGQHMLSVQGHPEFSEAFAKAVLNVRQTDFPRKRFEDGMQSFSEKALDGALLAAWFVNFLSH